MSNGISNRFSRFITNEKYSIIVGVGLGACLSVVALTQQGSADTVQARNTLNVANAESSVIEVLAPKVDDLIKVDASYTLRGMEEQLGVNVDAKVIEVQKDYVTMTSIGQEALVQKEKAQLEEEKRRSKEVSEAREQEKLLSLSAGDLSKKEKKLVNKTKSEYKHVATFEITGYCCCRKCCGCYSPQVTGKSPHTASGTIPSVGRTVAVDPDVIPLGSLVIIGNHCYIAEDTGSAVKGNIIDVYFKEHQCALEWGRRTLEVTYIVK